MLYPLDRLPTVPGSTEPEKWKTRTTLTGGERDEIQCAYLWLQAYTNSTTEALPPPSPQPTYAELWYMLMYFQQIQILVNAFPSSLDHLVAAHAARYLAAIEGELPRGARALSFCEVRGWRVPTGAVARCAAAFAQQPPPPAVTPPFGPTASSAGGGELAAYVSKMELL